MRALAIVLLLAAPAVGRAQPCDDAALSLAAADVLSGVARDIGRAARARGSTLPVVRALRVTGAGAGRVARFLSRIRARGSAPVVCGEAHSEGSRLVLAGALSATLTLADGLATIELAAGWRDARLYVRDARGEMWQQAFVAGRAEIPSNLAPPIDVQVVATGPDGPRPVAEQRVGEGPTFAVVRSDEPIATRVDYLRESLHVGPLRRNRLLERVAARHAATICREGRVAHVIGGADPVERLAREGIRARHVGETAARSRDLDHAYAATLRSPSHRSALADRRFTDIGVGAAEGRCLVILLAAWPRAVPYR